MSSMKPTEWGMLILLSVFWGGSFFFVEIALRDFRPFTVVFLRVTLAALILTGTVYLRGQRMPVSLNVWGAFLVMGALNNAIPFSLIVWGQTRIDSGVASILNATTPIFTVILAHILTSDERLTLGKLLGVGVLCEVIHLLEYVGMGCISLGLIVIDGRALKWLKYGLKSGQKVAFH